VDVPTEPLTVKVQVEPRIFPETLAETFVIVPQVTPLFAQVVPVPSVPWKWYPLRFQVPLEVALQPVSPMPSWQLLNLDDVIVPITAGLPLADALMVPASVSVVQVIVWLAVTSVSVDDALAWLEV
jgi:hypothetical protein